MQFLKGIITFTICILTLCIMLSAIVVSVTYTGNYLKFNFVNKTTGTPVSIIVVGEKAPGGASDTIAAADIAAQIGNLAYIVKTETYPTTAEIKDLVKATAVTITTITCYNISKSIAILDSEVTGTIKATYNMILVGGPEANEMVKDLVGKKVSKVTWTEAVDGAVEYIADPYGTGKDVLIVAGATREGTRKAAADLVIRF
ncbi:MAG: S-layer protein [Euryarchaeota archaeon]|nr:S-layer protein [Euryarchaeota archaeon]